MSPSIDKGEDDTSCHFTHDRNSAKDDVKELVRPVINQAKDVSKLLLVQIHVVIEGTTMHSERAKKIPRVFRSDWSKSKPKCRWSTVQTFRRWFARDTFIQWTYFYIITIEQILLLNIKQ